MAPKVVDTTYYDTLQVAPDATELEIKKAYRRLALIYHPDKAKEEDAETAHEKFQAIGAAYQVLSNTDLRKQYDRFGPEKAVPDSGFADPAEFFTMIFGGEAFIDLIGEISLMKDLSRTMDITQQQMQEEEEEAAAVEAAKKASMADAAAASGKAAEASSSTAKPATAVDEPPPPYVAGEKAAEKTSAHTPSTATPPEKSGSPYASGTSTPRRGIPMRPALMDRSEEDAALDANLTEEEKELRKKEKKKAGLTKEQREELLAYEKERKRIRDERVETLSKKLVDRISIWTETDKGADVTAAFQTKTQLEVENLKMESFGLDILHAIGTTYLQKASSFLKSQKFLGISGFFSRLKDKGTLARETWTTISTAIDAQMTMEEMAKMEEKGGEDWTDEKKAEYEQRVTGKVLAAAWRGSKFEIQSVLRDVCDKVLNDKDVSLNKRIERAHALMISGEIYNKAHRDPDEEGEFMAFEKLMADAAKKRSKDKDKETKDKDPKEKEKEDKKSGKGGHLFGHHHDHSSAGAAPPYKEKAEGSNS